MVKSGYFRGLTTGLAETHSTKELVKSLFWNPISLKYWVQLFFSLFLDGLWKLSPGLGLSFFLICGQGPVHRHHTESVRMLSWQRTLRNAERATSQFSLNYNICLDSWLKAIWKYLWPPLWPSSISLKQKLSQLIAKNNLEVSKLVCREASTRVKSQGIQKYKQLIEQRQSWSLESPVAVKETHGNIWLRRRWCWILASFMGGL